MNATSDKKVEVLITTMHCEDALGLLKRMNIQGAARIGNQCDHNQIGNVSYLGYDVPLYEFSEKGVGLNRNNLLMRSDADYCLFGDDDLIYMDGYEAMIQRYFLQYPDADVLLFNLIEEKTTRFLTTKDFKVNFFNFMRFGAARMAIRTKCIQTNGILFNTCFGGGTPHNHGEDTLFLNSCLKAGLHVYAIAENIATLSETRESSWFHGYDEKYFLDKGLLYYLIHRKHYRFLIFQDAIRHRGEYQKSFSYLWKTMKRGVLDAVSNRFE